MLTRWHEDPILNFRLKYPHGWTVKQIGNNSQYKPVTFPHTITGLSVGTHTIYLRLVDQAGKANPTPAKWTITFTVIKDDDEGCLIDPVFCSATPVEDPETWINWVRTPGGTDIPKGRVTHTHTLYHGHRRLFQGTVSQGLENSHRPERIETTDRLRACNIASYPTSPGY
jgi:hypothetical protein